GSAKRNYITQPAICSFLTHLGLDVDAKRKKKYFTLLYYGKRRLEFCHRLSKMKQQFQDFSHNVNFEDIKYGFLYLFLDERMWRKASAFRDIFDETLRVLDIQKVLDAVETSGANLAAKAILQYGQALVQGQPALSNGKDINCTLTSDPSEAENAVQEPRAPADESNSTAASKRSSTEAGLDDPTASKRFRQNVDFLVEAVMCQSATASETVIANDSNPQTMQPNNAPSLNNTPSSNNTSSPNSEIDRNLPDTQDGDMNATSEEPELPDVADLCTINWNKEQEAILNMHDWSMFGDYGFSSVVRDLLAEINPLPNLGSLSMDRTDTLQASTVVE
ncbi:hypothetical protein N5P37_011815, partial [Trichoderma harzianum]